MCFLELSHGLGDPRHHRAEGTHTWSPLGDSWPKIYLTPPPTPSDAGFRRQAHENVLLHAHPPRLPQGTAAWSNPIAMHTYTNTFLTLYPTFCRALCAAPAAGAGGAMPAHAQLRRHRDHRGVHAHVLRPARPIRHGTHTLFDPFSSHVPRSVAALERPCPRTSVESHFLTVCHPCIATVACIRCKPWRRPSSPWRWTQRRSR